MNAAVLPDDEAPVTRRSRASVGRRPGVLPPEEALLLLTAGAAGNDDAIRELARGTIDWQRFLGLAQIERAVPVIYPRLRDLTGEFIPPGILDQMRRLALVSEFAMLHLESRLVESLRALGAANVRVMLLKGAALAHTAYASVRQRPMSDIDLLVDPSNAHVARRVLTTAGWKEFRGPVPESVYDRHHHLPPLTDSGASGLQLEIHTALFPERQPFAFDARDLWGRAVPLGGSFPDAFAPHPTHSLLHACLHFLWSHQGRFGVWRTVRDVDALTRNGGFDWDEFVRAARAARGATSCFWTFRIAQITGGVLVPENVVDALRPPRRAYLLNAVERHFLGNLFPVEFACPSVALDHALWELAVMPRWSGHGEIRPWDEESEFAAPRDAANPERALAKGERVRRLVASSAYVRTLLTSPKPAR